MELSNKMEKRINVLIIICIILCIQWTAVTGEEENRCTTAATCGMCLEAGGSCKWCADEDFEDKASRKPRCNTLDKLKEHNCSNIQIEDSKTFRFDSDFSEGNQIVPKKIQFYLRPGETQKFTLSVKPAENYPVRLYYLMDMSNSMRDDLENLKDLGSKIAKEIKDITSNFQLAFGTFVDKSMTPFNWLTKEKPCADCVPAFGYHHIFDFDNDAALFTSAVKKQKISGNLDAPEGGFDALMQVAVCGDKIWPKESNSRKIVLYVTDAPPHIAGDGKIGGITIPNDGECHLSVNPDGILHYEQSLQMDYPSVSFLRYKLKENGIIPIIAGTSNVAKEYEDLREQWKDLGTAFGVLDKDSGNIVELIRDNYKKISTTVRLSDNAPSNLAIKYEAKGGCSQVTRDNECVNVRINQQIDFTVSVTANTCPDDHNKGDKFSVTVPGFGDVEIDVNYICECGCDAKDVEINSPKCNKTGDFKCGICNCDEGRFGNQCQCDSETQEDDTLCIKPNSTDHEVCSGLGSCVCGKCACNELSDRTKKIYGTYCQCNNFGCDRFNGKICGGPERGTCKCGACECKGIYMGENCGEKNCTLGRQECIKDGDICSGNGRCSCDTCECDYGYSGKHCSKCVFCKEKCKNDERCVLCHAPYNMGEKDYCETCKLEIELVNITQTDIYGEKKCSVYYNETCRVYYSFNTQNESIFLEDEPRCVEIVAVAVPILPIVLGIIGGIVFIGLLLLLLWKLLVTMHDQKEYNKFKDSLKQGTLKSDQNPLFISPQTKFTNPTYVGKTDE